MKYGQGFRVLIIEAENGRAAAQKIHDYFQTCIRPERKILILERNKIIMIGDMTILGHIFHEIGEILGWSGASGDSKLVFKILEELFGKN